MNYGITNSKFVIYLSQLLKNLDVEVNEDFKQ